jgi:hypothetical protein
VATRWAGAAFGPCRPGVVISSVGVVAASGIARPVCLPGAEHTGAQVPDPVERAGWRLLLLLMVTSDIARVQRPWAGPR